MHRKRYPPLVHYHEGRAQELADETAAFLAQLNDTRQEP